MRNLATLWWETYHQKKVSVLGNDSNRNMQIGDIGDINDRGIMDAVSVIGVGRGTVGYRAGCTSNIGSDSPKLSNVGKYSIGSIG